MRYTALYRDGHSQATNENHLVESCSPLPEKTFKGRPYSEIIAEWWRQNGGEPQEGERNVKLYQLAVSLRAICDNNRELLLQIMPRLGLSEEELRSIVESACKEPPKGISKVMQAVLQRTVPEPAEGSCGSCDPLVASDLRSSATGSPTVPSTAERDISQRLWDWGAKIEALSEDYPIIKDITKGLKRNQFLSSPRGTATPE